MTEEIQGRRRGEHTKQDIRQEKGNHDVVAETGFGPLGRFHPSRSFPHKRPMTAEAMENMAVVEDKNTP
jgi:hypothetical protein